MKANATRLMSNGYFRVSAKYIDDSNQFILPLPFEDPSDPHPVSGFSDTGAFTTPEGVNASVPLPTGDILNLPLDDGIRTKGTWLTGEYNFNFGDNWNFVDTAQFMSADHQWNAIAPGTPLDANEYAQGVLNDFIGKGLAPPGSTYQLLFTNVLDAKGNKEPFDTPNNLLSPSTQFHVLKPISAFQDKLGFRKTWDRNSLAFGTYFAYYTQDNKWFFPNILMDVRDNPHWVDMVITEPDGSKLDVTKNGFRNFLPTYVNAEGKILCFHPSSAISLM